MKLFNDYMDCGKDFAQVEALFQSRLEETQRSSIKYGFRNDQWLIKHHGEKKATKIMQRKKKLGLKLGHLFGSEVVLWVRLGTAPHHL